jgi:isopenicillin N synthase-like dioxygenase
VVRDPSNYGPNRWPTGLSDFAPVMSAYFQEMLRVSQQVLRALMEQNVTLEGFEVAAPDLDEIFIRVVTARRQA